ncbi:MAG: glycosyltransferase [Bacteroidales bacterium]
MKLDVLICTYNSGIEKAYDILQEKKANVRYIVSHQYTDDKYRCIPAELERDDVLVTQIQGLGLSRNRNNALKYTDSDIALIADDDVKYLPDAFNNLLDIFKGNPCVDIALFKIKTPEGEPEYKSYPQKSYQFNNSKNHSISSIEIAFRPDRVKSSNIRFDERFGLGNSFLIAGEENIFVFDCIRAGLKVMFYPIFIVEHTVNSTVRKIPTFGKPRIRLRAAMVAYKKPFLAIPIAFARTIKHTPVLIKLKQNPFIYLYENLRAIIYVWTTKK